MIEISSKVMNSNELEIRVAQSVQMKQIPKEFYGTQSQMTDVQTGNADVNQMLVWMQSVLQNIEMMNTMWVLSEQPITSSRKFIGKFVVFCKKVVRKLTRWLLQPYFVQQTNFNGAVTRAVSDMQKIQATLIQMYEQQEKRGE